jgi:hypothetical protein
MGLSSLKTQTMHPIYYILLLTVIVPQAVGYRIGSPEGTTAVNVICCDRVNPVEHVLGRKVECTLKRSTSVFPIKQSNFDNFVRGCNISRCPSTRNTNCINAGDCTPSTGKEFNGNFPVKAKVKYYSCLRYDINGALRPFSLRSPTRLKHRKMACGLVQAMKRQAVNRKLIGCNRQSNLGFVPCVAPSKLGESFTTLVSLVLTQMIVKVQSNLINVP